MLKFIKVSGNSLSPAYKDGDFVLIVKISIFFHKINFFRRIKAGDIIVFMHPRYGRMIKKVERFLPDKDEIYVLGTQEFSVDSREFGPIHSREVIGKVIWHIPRPSRINSEG
jgi:signal peptidase I